MNSIFNLQAARADLAQFVQSQPGSNGKPGWQTAPGGKLTAAELAARIDLVHKYQPAQLLSEAQRWGHAPELIVEARPDLDRASFISEFFGVARSINADGDVVEVQPSGTSDEVSFIDGQPSVWRSPQGPLLPAEHAARKDFTTKHPSKVANALMDRHHVDLDTVVATSAALDRQGYIDRYHKPEPSGNNTGAVIIPQQSFSQQPAAGSPNRVHQALLNLMEAQVESSRLNLQMEMMK